MYQRRAEKVKEYLEFVKDFDELISPQSLFLHFLGPEPSTKAQEKKAKDRTVNGLLSKKKTGDVSKKDSVTTLPLAYSPAKRPASPTLSLEVVASGGEEVRKKKKAGGKKVFCRLWGSLYSSREPLVKSLSAKNETLKNKVIILIAEAENDKECMATLEKSLQDFKYSDEYSDEVCKYYVEGFDLLMKWMAKHHPGLDLFGLAVDDVEKELMSNHPYEATTKNVTEGATSVAEVMEEAAITTPTDPITNEQ
nr:hypothetical protein CFP56_12415 [Quercus suber]